MMTRRAAAQSPSGRTRGDFPVPTAAPIMAISLATSLWMSLALLSPPSMASAGPAEAEARRGVELYSQDRLDEAVEAFKKAGELDPESAAIQYNLGTALATRGEFDQASEALVRALNFGEAPSRRDAFFNLGFSHVLEAQGSEAGPPDPPSALKSLRQGLEAFREAIVADPTDREAKHNFQLTRRLIRRIEEMMQNQQQQGGESDEDGEQQENQEQQQGEQEKQSDQRKDQSDQQKDSDRSDPSDEQSQQEADDSQQDSEQEQQRQSGGLETTPTPGPTPPSKSESPSQENQEQQLPPLTPEQLDALRILNSLEQESPEQFKRLFQFRGQKRRKRLERDW